MVIIEDQETEITLQEEEIQEAGHRQEHPEVP